MYTNKLFTVGNKIILNGIYELSIHFKHVYKLQLAGDIIYDERWYVNQNKIILITIG